MQKKYNAPSPGWNQAAASLTHKVAKPAEVLQGK